MGLGSIRPPLESPARRATQALRRPLDCPGCGIGKENLALETLARSTLDLGGNRRARRRKSSLATNFSRHQLSYPAMWNLNQPADTPFFR